MRLSCRGGVSFCTPFPFRHSGVGRFSSCCLECPGSLTGRLCALCIARCSCSFFYCAPKQWNSLPSDIRHIQSSHAFKTALETHLHSTTNTTTGDFKFCLLPFVPLTATPTPFPLSVTFRLYMSVCAQVCCVRYTILCLLFIFFVVEVFM